MSTSVGQVCKRNPVTCAGDAEIRDVVESMRENQVGSIVLVNHTSDGIRPCGIITDRDLVVRVIAAGIDLDSLTVRDVATTEVTLAHENDSIGDAIHIMREQGVKRLPIVDARGCLIGILSGNDLLLYLANEVQELASTFMRGNAGGPGNPRHAGASK